MSVRLPLSVVICVKNEERRIEACLSSVVAEAPHEIILVDGNSSDRTVEIARGYVGKLVERRDSNLTRDRQAGVDCCRNDLIALIDADHRLRPGDLNSLLDDMDAYGLDLVQAGLEIEDNGFWCRAETAALDVTQNIPGRKRMVGVAPCIFRRSIFDYVRFDDKVTSTIDDTDFIYRLSKVGRFAIGTGRTRIVQKHEGELVSYLRKFRWYGRGDGEFCVKHPERAVSMLYHLGVRYPIIYSVRAIAARRPSAVPFVFLQGAVRLWNLIRRVLELKLAQNRLAD